MVRSILIPLRPPTDTSRLRRKLDGPTSILWAQCRTTLNVPVGFDTDVNAAVLGEARWGAARDRSGHLPDFIYLTIGTGIGGGAMVRGEVLHGLVHPEMGHLRIPHDLVKDPYPGNCPYHGDCLEGLASGPAIQNRWDKTASELPVGHPAWALEAHYLALGLVNLTLALSPRRILLGGGVMQQPRLFEGIRQEFSAASARVRAASGIRGQPGKLYSAARASATSRGCIG